MNKPHEVHATRRRERRLDETLNETFPASDPPFVGAGTPIDDEATIDKSRARSAEMAGEAIDRHADQSATSDEQEGRKQRLLKGPKEFRNLRRDQPRESR